MLWSAKNTQEVRKHCDDWSIKYIYDRDSIVVSGDETEMKIFNGFLCNLKIRPFWVFTIVNFGEKS